MPGTTDPDAQPVAVPRARSFFPAGFGPRRWQMADGGVLVRELIRRRFLRCRTGEITRKKWLMRKIWYPRVAHFFRVSRIFRVNPSARPASGAAGTGVTKVQ